ncbi:MAG TPA: sulfite exporter TauE/SafE family protein [Candidatus Sulfotelmatobacter sp.]|nr:sulfite exporter TauE/SafE family protein [Candidatus Sulfotelmatobacter sp.]
MPDHFWILATFAIVAFLATALQALTGFGFALIVMPLASMLLGIRTAAPLVALTALTLYAVNVIRYRESLSLGEVWRLAVASAAGVPVGVWVVARANETLVKMLLGAVLIGYSLHSFVHSRPKARCAPPWAYLFGFLSGSLGGAYNTSGPPVVMYAVLRQWPKDEFRAALQTLFLVSGAMTVLWHALAHHFSTAVLGIYMWTPLALAAGLWAGIRVDRHVDRERFRLLVVAMVFLLGLSLVLNLGR